MENEKFDYTYSAKDEKNLIKIKDKYRSKTKKEAKMDELIALDKSTTSGPSIIAITFGIVGTLILGVGLTCVTVWTNYFILGIVIGIIGIIVSGISYPLYVKMVKVKREKVAPLILKLAEEIEQK